MSITWCGLVPVTSPSSNGNQTYTDSNMTGTVKGAIFFLTAAASADTYDTSIGSLMIGACDGTNQRCQSWWSDDNVTPTDCGSRTEDDYTIMQLVDNGVERANATFVSFGTGSVTVNWTIATTPSLANGFVLLFGGDEVIDFDVNHIVRPGVGSTTSISGNYNTLFFFQSAQNTGIDGTQNTARINAGFASRYNATIKMASFGTRLNDDGTNTGGRAFSATKILRYGTNATDEFHIEVSAWDDSAATINNQSGWDSSGDYIPYVAIRFDTTKVIAESLGSFTSNSTSLAAPYEPKLVLVLASGATALDTLQTGGRAALGCIHDESGQIGIGYSQDYTGGVSVSELIIDTTHIINLPSGAGGALWQVTGTIDADSFDVTHNVDPATTRYGAALAFCAVPPVIGGIPLGLLGLLS